MTFTSDGPLFSSLFLDNGKLGFLVNDEPSSSSVISNSTLRTSESIFIILKLYRVSCNYIEDVLVHVLYDLSKVLRTHC